MKNTVRKVLTYSTKLDKLVQHKAQQRGISSQAYIEYLILKDVEDIVDVVEELTDEEIKAVGRATEDFKKGRYVTIKPGEDIGKALDKELKKYE